MPKVNAGRPRSEKAREAIIDAVRELLHESGGAALSIEAIARRAGVGKPTIYRWWPSLADVVLEALLQEADESIDPPAFESLYHSLRGFLRRSMAALEGGGPQLRFIMAQAQQDEAFRERFREQFVARRRAVLRSIFEQAAARGQLGAGHSPELLVDVVFGAMWYRLLVGHAPLDEALADGLTDMVMGLASGDPR